MSDPIDEAIARALAGGGGYDPNTDPSAWLGSHGFTWKSGNGAYAIWQAPNGQQISQQNAIALARQIETQQPKESGKLGDTVNIGGRVKQWNPKTATYDIDLGSSQAPQAPRYPDAGIAGNRAYRTDPYTGEITFGEAVPGTLSPEQQRQNDLADAEAQRRFTSGENAATRTATATSAAAERAARAAEFAANYGQNEAQFGANYGAQGAEAQNAYNQRTGEFGANYGRGVAGDENAYNQYLAGFQRQQQQDALAGAEQYSRLVSQVDPAALPAFYSAGGGNIMNAVAAGRDALSENALLPAARTLRGLENPVQPAGFVRAPAYTPAPYQQAPAYTPRPYVPPPVPQQAPQAAVITQPAAPAPQTWGQQQAQANAGLTGEAAAAYNAAFGPGGSWGVKGGVNVPGFAGGTQGFVDAPGMFMVNDAQPQDQEMIQVQDPEHNARIRVTPAGGMMPQNMPHYALGTEADPSGMAQPIDASYIDRVRQFRQSVDVRPPIEGGYMNVGFTNLAPSLQNRYTAGFAPRYGVPQQDVQAEQRRYALRGFQRPYSQGY